MPEKKHYLFLGSLLASTLGAAALCSADPTHGRLSDGRAYRIDNGMRLTDYIAELEVTNDDLKRQLNALESELDEKNARLEKAGNAPSPAIRERDLVTGRSADHSGDHSLPRAQTASANVDCSLKTQPLEAKISTLEQQLQSSQQARACNYQSTDNPLWAEVSSLREQLAQRPKAEQVSNLNAKAEKEQEGRIWAEEETEKLRAALTALQSESASLKSQLEQSRSELRAANENAQARAALAAAPPPAAVAAAVPVKEAPKAIEVAPKLSTQAETSVESIGNLAAARADLKKQLGTIQSLVSERKNLLDSVKSRGKGVSISLQPLVTQNGKSLDSIRVDVNGLNSGSDIAAIRSDLQQIAGILNDDIGVLKRLAH